MSRVPRTILVLLLCAALGVPARAQTTTAEYLQQLAAYLSANQFEQAYQFVARDPQQSMTAFQDLIQVYTSGTLDQERQNAVLIALNLIAKVFEVRLGQGQLMELLRSNGAVTGSDQEWAAMGLQGASPGTVDAATAAQVIQEARLTFNALNLAVLSLKLGNYLAALQLVQYASGSTEQLVARFQDVNPEAAEALPLVRLYMHEINLAILGALGFDSAVLELGPALLEEASKIPDQSAPEVGEAMQDIRVIMAAAAHHLGRPREVRANLSEAGKLARGSTRPGTIVNLFTIVSMEYQLEHEQRPNVPLSEFLRKHDEAWRLLKDLRLSAEDQAFLGYALTTASFWFHELAARAQTAEAAQKKVLSQRIDSDMAILSNVLAQSMKLAQQNLEKRLSGQSTEPMDQLVDPQLAGLAEMNVEILVGSADAQMDLAAQTREAGFFAEARAALDAFEQVMTQADSVETLVNQVSDPVVQELKPVLLRSFPDTPANSFPNVGINRAGGLNRLRGRLHEERARLLLAEADEKPDAARAQEALAEAEKAIEYYRGSADVRALMNLQPAYALLLHYAGSAAQAESVLKDNLEAAEALGSRPARIETLMARGTLRAQQGNPKAAIEDLQAATGLVEQYITEVGGDAAAAGRIRDRVRRAYDLLTRLQLEAGQGQEALATLDRMQQVRLATGKVTTRDPEALQKLENVEERQATIRSLEEQKTTLEQLPSTPDSRKQLDVVSRELASTRKEFVSVINDLKRSHPEIYRRVGVDPLDFTRFQRVIPKDTAVVQFFPSDAGELYIIVVTAEDFGVVSIKASVEELERLVRSYRASIKRYAGQAGSAGAVSWVDDGSSNYKTHVAPLKEVSGQLYSMLIQPVESRIQNKQVLVFLPSGMLYYLPLQALGRPTPNGDFEFLIEKKQVVTLSKPGDFMDLQGAPHAGGGNMLAVGNPDGTLPKAEEEAVELGKLFPGSVVLVGSEATTEKLLSQRGPISYLHLATHGRLNRQDPEQSHLVMAANGKLDFDEFYDLLHGGGGDPRLVTLSACQTAVGEGAREERLQETIGAEIFSLAHSVWSAGAPTVVASLWSVSDDSTRHYMVTFYEHLKKGETLARALQSAQIRLLRESDGKYAHPFYWAPFVLWGDWR